MNRLDYAQGVVVASVYEKRLLKRDILDKMIKANDNKEVMKILMETDYSKSSLGVNSIEDYPRLLKQETTRMFMLGQEMLENEKILQLLSLKYDYHNLKSIIKAHIAGIDLENLFIYSMLSDPNKIKLQFENAKFTDIRPEFKKALLEASENYNETKDPQMIDITIDRCFYNHLRKIASELDIELFNNYATAIIDFYNLSSMMRAKNMGKNTAFLDEILVDGGDISKSKLIKLSKEDFEKIVMELKNEKFGKLLMKYLDEYKKTKSYTVIESVKSEYMSKIREDSKFVFFGPEPIFSYLMEKEKEIAIVRTILTGKLNHVTPEKIRERLSDIYNV